MNPRACTRRQGREYTIERNQNLAETKDAHELSCADTQAERSAHVNANENRNSNALKHTQAHKHTHAHTNAHTHMHAGTQPRTSTH